MLLQALNELGNVKICHDNITINGTQIYCYTCHNHLCDVQQIILNLNCYSSCALAKIFCEHTGQIDILCQVAIHNIKGIKSQVVTVQYQDLVLANRIFGILLNAFYILDNDMFQLSNQLNQKIMKSFLSKYINKIENVKYEQDNIHKIIVPLLQHLKQIINDHSMIDYYFKTLVPYVKLCNNFKEPIYLDINSNYYQSPMHLFEFLNDHISQVRSHFSRYSIQMDGIFVMIYCYLCTSDTNLLANFILDFVYRIVKITSIDTLLSTRCIKEIHKITQTHRDLYYMKRNINNGECINLLSVELIEQINKMAHLLLPVLEKDLDPAISKYAIMQTFPYILFPTPYNYYGYILALSLMLKRFQTKNHTLPKHTVNIAKTVFKFIETYSEKISKWDIPFFDVNTLQLFIASDNNFLKIFEEICTHLVTK